MQMRASRVDIYSKSIFSQSQFNNEINQCNILDKMQRQTGQTDLVENEF